MKNLTYKYKIIFSFLLVEFIFLSIIIAYNYIHISNFTNELVKNETQVKKELFKKLIQTPLITYDLATLDDLVNNFVDLPMVKSVRIFDYNNKLLSNKIETTKEDNDKYYLYFENEKIIDNNDNLNGYISFVFDSSKTVDIVKEHTKEIIIIATFEIILSFFLSFFIALRLSKNLQSINNTLENYSLDINNKLNLNIHSNDEFEKIAQTIEKLDLKLKETLSNNIKQQKILMEQSKDAEMGSMISAIIHQWRQPISIIALTNSSIKMDITLEDVDLEDLMDNCEMIDKQIEEMTNTINDFRDFFNPNKEETIFNITNPINKTIAMIKPHYSKNNISIINNIKEEHKELFVKGFENEIKQVIINILNNARDAIIDNNVERKEVEINSRIKDKYIVLDIKDYAGGIPKNIISKIFEPYFTTKGEEKGTGIGLDMSKKIIDKHQGNLSVNNYSNNNEKGAIFSIELLINKEEN